MNWGMPIVLRGAVVRCQSAQIVALGNALPDFRFAITQSVSWRRVPGYGGLDAAIGHSGWDQGVPWASLGFPSQSHDQAGRSRRSATPHDRYWSGARSLDIR